MITTQQAALNAAHKPAVRKRAAATMHAQFLARSKLAKAYGEKATAFMQSRLVDTVTRHEIPWSKIPEVLMNGFGKKERAELLAKGKNGHDRAPGVGIPLDAIPARKPKAAPGERGTYGTKSKAHPNAAQIDKVLDLLADANTDKDRGDRLLAALDKLLL